MNTILNWRPSLAATFFVSAILLFASCSKIEDQIGSALQEDGDLLGAAVVDTFRLESYTFKADSSRTTGLSVALLGDLQTPEFGRLNSSIYTQVRLSSLLPAIADTAIVDSLVLVFKYATTSAFYGYEDEMRFKVYRLTEDISVDSLYYSNDDILYGAEDLMHDSYIPSVPNSEDSVVTMLGDTLRPQLRMRLNDAITQEVFAEARIGTYFGALTEFSAYFKGFKVVAEKVGPRGNILGFDLLSIDSKLAMYYHVESPDTVIPLRYDFLINENTARFLHFDHDYAGTQIEMALDSDPAGSQYGYVQSMAGLNLAYRFPSLRDLNLQGGIAINKAQLIIPLSYGQDTSNVSFPDRLFAVYRNDEGVITSVPDIFEGESFSDGYYDEEEGAYLINLTRFTQQVLNQVITNPELMVIPTRNSTSAGMVQVYGPENMTQQARLRITYTEYE
jgi:hypothetical protein